MSFSFTVPAKIASFSQFIDVEWKKDLDLLCESVGIPESVVVWKLNGVHIELGSRQHVRSGEGVVDQTVAIEILVLGEKRRMKS